MNTELDDLVIWASERTTVENISDFEYHLRLAALIPSSIKVRYFRGPLHAQRDLDPTTDDLNELPVVCHIPLSAEERDKAFIFISETTTELHLPETYIASGACNDDDVIFMNVQSIARMAADYLRIEWDTAEYGGNTVHIGNATEFWPQYLSNLRERLRTS